MKSWNIKREDGLHYFKEAENSGKNNEISFPYNFDYEGSGMSIRCYVGTFGYDCCVGGVPVFWKNNENNTFIDRTREVLVTIKDKTMRFRVQYCPICGRKLGSMV